MVENPEIKGLEDESASAGAKTKRKSVPKVRLTTKRDLLGFYIYASSYIPYMLAAGNFVSLMISGYASTASVNPDGTRCSALSEGCTVAFFWSRIKPSSLSFYMSSIGVGIQALVLIFFSALADRASWRRQFILTFTLVGGLSASSYLLFRDPSHYLILALMTALANSSVGIASAFYYAYLPVLVRNHPEVRQVTERTEGLPETEAEPKVALVRDRVSNSISGTSLAVGLVSGSVVLFFAALVGSSLSKGPYVQQVGAGMAGLWWLVAGLVGWWVLPKFEGPPLPENCKHPHPFDMYALEQPRKCGGGVVHLVGALVVVLHFGWAYHRLDGHHLCRDGSRDRGHGFRERLPVRRRPLAEAFGITVLTQLKNRVMRSSSSKGMNILLTGVCAALTLWGILGLHTSVGIKAKPEYFIYFTTFVTLYACLQSFHRVLFAELVPLGREAEFFGLYLISSRGTGWIGTTVVGVINERTRVVRNGYYFILALFLSGILAILPLNMARGYRNASRLAVAA
ncbi:Autophagy protein 22 [Massospora cicadina]|nr:Autophagy protein 22 [Massospora cicadina]